MKVAGVRLHNGGICWARAGSSGPAVLDRVLVRHGNTQEDGVVYVTDEQLVGDAPEPTATVLSILPRQDSRDRCENLPGADLPCLGSQIEHEGRPGTVLSVDAVNRVVMILLVQGEKLAVSWPVSEMTDTESGG